MERGEGRREEEEEGGMDGEGGDCRWRGLQEWIGLLSLTIESVLTVECLLLL